jgi:hypothetical protein
VAVVTAVYGSVTVTSSSTHRISLTVAPLVLYSVLKKLLPRGVSTDGGAGAGVGSGAGAASAEGVASEAAWNTAPEGSVSEEAGEGGVGAAGAGAGGDADATLTSGAGAGAGPEPEPLA